MNQTGAKLNQRVSFLSNVYNKVQLNPATAWEPENEYPSD
jgi:hypothetical protein